MSLGLVLCRCIFPPCKTIATTPSGQVAINEDSNFRLMILRNAGLIFAGDHVDCDCLELDAQFLQRHRTRIERGRSEF